MTSIKANINRLSAQLMWAMSNDDMKKIDIENRKSKLLHSQNKIVI